MKNRKGFTLIELLAVIVILGLLMAIAIPSVTKYITESRKKTLTTTVNNYIGALVNEVNDLSYTFTGQNTIYAVPIECIALERGGTDPFGHWYQANDSYFAYVLIQYDDQNSKYIYGFTFKDSAGYGLYPTIQSNIKEKGSQVKTGYTINKPVTGELTSLVTLAKWQESGFKVDSNTSLKVLEATSEGQIGDGINTCTLQQKGDNYEKVENDKNNSGFDSSYLEEDKNKTDDQLPILMKRSNGEAFWQYNSKIKTITFEKNINIPSEITNEYKWDVSSTGNGMVMAYITPNSTDSNFYDLYIQGDGRLYANADSSNLFYTFWYVENINNIGILDTSKVTNMKSMFEYTGRDANTFNIDGLNGWDTSNVINMSSMFDYAGNKATKINLDLSNWDTSNVTDMSYMFNSLGSSATTFSLNLNNWDTSNVTDMDSMFQRTGKNATTFNIGGLSNLDTSKVTDMDNMLYEYGYNLATFNLDLSKWDTSNVTSMNSMFNRAGYKSTTFNIIGLNSLDTSKVTNMNNMFYETGYNATTLNLDFSNWDTSNLTTLYYTFYHTGYNATTINLNFSNWNISNVTNMSGMFVDTGGNATALNIVGLNNWDTSNVTNMEAVFIRAGQNATTFNIGDLSKWNTSNVTTMRHMFWSAGEKATWSLDCSNWNVDKVTNHNYFNYQVSSKVKAPTWK